jgi:hypothetical protein
MKPTRHLPLALALFVAACGGSLPDDPHARLLLCNALSGEAPAGPRKQAAMRAIAQAVLEEMAAGRISAAQYKADYDAASAEADAMSGSNGATAWQACLEVYAPA